MIYQNNSFKEDLLLLPGWATDIRVFNPFFLKQFDYNFIYPELSDLAEPHFLLEKIFEFSKSKVINCLGWSMGSFLVMDFILKYGAEKKIKNVFLYGIRQSYNKSEIKKVRLYLKKNKNLYLREFYREAALEESLAKEYADLFEEQFLLSGLDYLEQANFPSVDTFIDKIDFLEIRNSLDDKIAIFSEYPKIMKNKKIKEIFLPGGSHAI